MRSVAVLGAGSWGTALAVHLARVGHRVQLWARDPALVADMRTRRANAVYLPDVSFPATLQPTDDLAAALTDAQFVLVAVPSHGVRQVLRAGAAHVSPSAVVLSATKGLEDGSLARMSEVIADEWANVREVAVLSGPSFAKELAAGLPTAVVVAASQDTAARHVQDEFRSGALRLYASHDLVGVELGGALKNVIAIAAGAVTGSGLGENARAAVVTRGLAELARLGTALGARRETLMGLSGLGDLLLSATSLTSRNTRFGYELARGTSFAELMGSGHALSEGARTAEAAVALGQRHGVELPISTAVADVLAGRASLAASVEALLARPPASSE